MYIPFKEYIIHKRKALRVKARGIMKSKSISAEVDSNSNSTMPMAYRTKKRVKAIFIRKSRQLTPKDEMGYGKPLTFQHGSAKGFPNNT